MRTLSLFAPSRDFRGRSCLFTTLLLVAVFEPALSPRAAHAQAPLTPASGPALAEAEDTLSPAPPDSGEVQTQQTMVPVGRLPSLQIKTRPGAAPGKALPLEHTDVDIEVSSFVARATVTQRFSNPNAAPIEAIYIFPLPERAAVEAFELRVGERVIKGQIKGRARAKQLYNHAKRQGKTAALLEQERSNVFKQSIANLAPGETVVVTLHYVQPLPYDAGAFELAFPMVVGPRYLHGSSPPGTASADPEALDPPLEQPPLLPAGMRPGQDISLRVHLKAGLPIRDFEVPSHQVNAVADGDTRLELTLSPEDSIPNRDFILRWWVDTAQLQAGLLTHADKRGKFFSLLLTPPKLDIETIVGQRELVFVVDVSGSMSGFPLWLAKKTMRLALSKVRPGDTFNLISFAGRPGRLWKRSRPATEGNIQLAQVFIDQMNAGGGTELLNALEAAFEGASDLQRHRYVIFLSDGYVGNEKQIMAQARAYVSANNLPTRRARVFAVGIGSSVNRMLISGLAKAGVGSSFVVSLREDPSRAVDALFKQIDHPILQELSLEFGGLPVRRMSVYPRRLPDLFGSKPVTIIGRYQGHGQGVLRLKAKTEDGRVFVIPIKVFLPSRDSHNEALASLWARAKIQALEDSMWGAGQGVVRSKSREIHAAVTRLGLRFHLLTAYTAFIAVDHSRRLLQGATPTRVRQTVPLAEGLQRETISLAPLRTVGNGAGSPGSSVYHGSVGSSRSSWGSVGHGAAASSGTLGVIRGGASGSSRGHGGLGLLGYGTAGGGAQARSGAGKGTLSGGGKKLVEKKSIAAMETSEDPDLAARVAGRTSPQIMRRLMDAHKGEAKRCYLQSLSRYPKLSGKLLFRLTIGAGGRVQTSSFSIVETEAPAGLARVGHCLLRRSKRWRFPVHAGGGSVKISYPFTFALDPKK